MINSEHVAWAYMVLTMMQRIWKLPEETQSAYDVSSLRKLVHLAAPCPPWLKHAFIDWLGVDAIYEIFAATEQQAANGSVTRAP
ncbi:hypothetical protein NQ036_14320 [Brevibacterium sp. 91QC2O2]|uniref:hypothetical protein n=1 Tax=Brevibacterium TaxID=1696 RepID=UPI00211B78A3|nr:MULTISPECIES: hypothetical protein [unclassified Brevibacterium]MCQ9369409.1 hypothetical protein [Brevibacterium sp. 91QC2O2]MCQ9387015.1 hypothetical protein [Brevibacterium sp. 68QC2CO]